MKILRSFFPVYFVRKNHIKSFIFILINLRKSLYLGKIFASNFLSPIIAENEVTADFSWSGNLYKSSIGLQMMRWNSRSDVLILDVTKKLTCFHSWCTFAQSPHLKQHQLLQRVR